jgi:Zn-dependent protease with chaperone function
MRIRALTLALALLLGGGAFAYAQELAGGAAPAATAPSPAASAAPAMGAPAAPSESGPVSVPEPTEKALKYYRSGNTLWIVENLWGFLVPLIILFTGFAARIRTLASRLAGGRWFWTIALFAVLYGLVGFLIDLPLAYCTGFARPHAYGLSDQLPSKWWGDAFKELGVGLVLSVLTLWIPYLLLKKSPKRWWLYTAIVAVPLVVLLMMITPVFIEPLFNKFGPMKDKGLEQRILALADRAGISGGKVYEVEKSVDTKTVNAYVNGIGQTKRIVLWDTTLRKLKPEETLFVMAHEMGHFVLGHVRQLVALISVLILLGLLAVHLTASGVIARFKDRLGFESLSDVASLPLLSLIFGLVFFVLTPAVFAFTRHTEHEADRFGLEITKDSRNAATAFVKLQQENLAIPRPGPIHKLFRESHPPLGERIDFANEYRPWATGQPLTYGKLFREK